MTVYILVDVNYCLENGVQRVDFFILQELRLVLVQHGYMPEVQWVWRGF